MIQERRECPSRQLIAGVIMKNLPTSWSIRLAAGWLFSAIAITSAAGQQPVSVPPVTSQISNPVSSKREALEEEKLRAEIAKFKVDRLMGYIVPVVNFLSVLGLLFGLYYQRQTAIKLQQGTQDATLKLQKRQETTNLELKITELVMDSPTNWHAQTKFNLLRAMYVDRLSSNFPNEFKPEEFPTTRTYELRLKLFDALTSESSNDKEKVLDVFRRLFPDERGWWVDEAYPDPSASAVKSATA
jgi:hypothetical protein